jgi:tetratricopeptide (TPR) repeat protein
VVGAALAELAGESGEGIAAREQLAIRGAPDLAHYLAQLGQATARAPTSFPLRMNGANARLQVRDLEGALVDADAALALRPGDPSALAVRGSVLLQLGRPQEAVAAFAPLRGTEYWALQPTLWYIAAHAGDRGRLAGFRAGAHGAIRRSRARRRVGLAGARARLHRARSPPGCAARAAQPGAELFVIALDAERAGDVLRARAELQRALAIVPDHGPSRAALARLGG